MAKAVGFFTDVTVCIGCKACEVACKEWNQLPGNPPEFLDSFDNTGRLDAQNWRHVKFIEKSRPVAPGGVAWTMMSDVCNGCRDCIAACPYHVIGFDEGRGLAQKCTFCYDRLQNNLMPACATACPTQSIRFGPLDEMRQLAAARVEQLHAQGMSEAHVYGDKEYGGLHTLFLLTDKPEVYQLPSAENAVGPRRNNRAGYLGSLATALLGIAGALVAFRGQRAAAVKEG